MQMDSVRQALKVLLLKNSAVVRTLEEHLVIVIDVQLKEMVTFFSQFNLNFPWPFQGRIYLLLRFRGVDTEVVIPGTERWLPL